MWQPSNLPSGFNLADEVVKGLVTSDDTSNFLASHFTGKSPEVILQAVSEVIDDPSQLLQEIYAQLEGTNPNFFHALIANAANLKKLPLILTTNFDCLVEHSLDNLGLLTNPNLRF